MRVLLSTVLLLLAAYGSAALGAESEISSSRFQFHIKAVEEHLYKWQVKEATVRSKLAFSAAGTQEEKALANYVASRVEFFKGNYAASLRMAQEAKQSKKKLPKYIDEYVEYIQKVAETGSMFKEVASRNFKVRYAHPKDKILVHFAIDGLEKSYANIGRDFNRYPDVPVIVEIFPSLESFSHASTLTLREIQTTGVVGVCKFNRIMILSPRLLPKGYKWLDTLAHEYAHYLIFVATENNMAVWLHEGLAKAHESRWRDDKRNFLTPLYETVLARALNENRLVPLEKMHPSFGKLDSADEAQLAFAQVGTMVEFLLDRWGEGVIPMLLQEVKERGDINSALQTITDLEFGSFYEEWEKDLRSKSLKEKISDTKVIELKFVEEGGGEDKGSELDLGEVTDLRAREYTRIGDLLRSRGRVRAAAYEYEKALRHNPLSPVVVNRLASVRNSMGKYVEAREVLIPLVDYFPGYPNTFINLGKSYMESGDYKRALRAYENVISIDPFDPELHSSLLHLYDKLGLKEESKSEREILAVLADKETR
ncbi:MAG: tetratricopeptide repeat protein [Thermodesulfobacteriota bacterium]